MRKTIQLFAMLLAMLLAGYSTGLRAEDIDVYVDNTSNGAVPNVLFIMDNGANFSASANGTGCAAYSDGTGDVPSLGSASASSILQCALVNAINGLPDGAVNIGLVVSNANSFAQTQDTTDPTKGGYHRACSGTTGGCVLRPLALMNTTNKASLIKFIKGWSDSGQSSADRFNVKVNTATLATAMQEAWAYYNGKTGLSGTTYPSSILAGGCQKNFIVYIGNTEKNPGNESNPSPAVTAAHGASAAQIAPVSGSVAFNPAVCGGTTSYSLSSSGSWGDEWARLMYQQDGGNAAQTGSIQNIISYSIGILGPPNKCSTETLGVMSSIAKQGGGKFFQTSDTTTLTTALTQVLNEVQAVNSVFSSASLPVSVNAQGTYLNQIFLGMFRPDSSANPRWMGNLKQYQLVPNSTGDLVLGDANGNAAISSAGTGFISPTAVSLWTYKDTTTEPDSGGGFFRNDLKGTPASAFDSADGEVVEKGGVAQQLRKENLLSTFSGAKTAIAVGSVNPRRLYTYCPAGASCVAGLTDASNEFSTNNGNISGGAFGTATAIAISSITRSGTLATVMTTGNHGLTGTPSVSISNTNQTEYNGTKTVTVTGLKTFTFAVPDNPTSPATGTYTVQIAGGTPIGITSISRTSDSTALARNSETATAVIPNHAFNTSSNVTISGAGDFNFTGAPSTATINVVTPTLSSITYPVSIVPRTPAQNSYTAAVNGTQVSGVAVSLTKSGSDGQGSTNNPHGYWVGMYITITNSAVGWNGTFKITSVPTTTTFKFNKPAAAPNNGSTAAIVTPSVEALAVGGITRKGTTVGAKAIVTGVPAKAFGLTVGQKRRLDIARTGTQVSSSESAYELTNVEVTCEAIDCTSFSYDITASPALTGGAGATIGITGANGTVTSLTRSGTTATAVVSMLAGAFTNGQTVTVAASGTPVGSESAYTGSWQITCVTCNTTTATFTFGPVTQSPVSPATGNNMQAFSATSSPDRDTVIKWVRGLDSQADEASPGGTIKVRESIHGDVLHSRPLVINYGDSRGIVAFYGANDGVFRAVNGNQTGSTSGVPPGGELWGLVLPDHYPYLYRQMVNAPELKFPSTLLPTAKAKDYFVDGPTGVYQKLNADNTINTAHIYITMRRGGRFMYALDVSTPTAPTVLWKISTETSGFSELGQTWSRPRLTLLQNYADPVLIFGGGYDPQQDAEPPGTDTMGRAVYVVNATTGALIWSASPSCPGNVSSATCKQVNAMIYSIPSEIGFVDRDSDGKTDKLYFGDMGGNIWRADVNTADTSTWSVTRLAALGCDAGACASGTTPRKFFFPPSVLTIKAPGATGSYDAVSVASGDREHPLKSTATGSSYNVADRFFMVKDEGTAVGTPSTNNLTLASLTNSTSTPYAGTASGFYMNFATGEKSVNAPLAVNGFIFFSTNRPIDRSITCAANLGEAKAYAVSPFDAASTSNTLAGGGMPPSAVSGLVNITTTNADNTVTNSVQKFCIGCGISGSALGGTSTGACTSALENCNIGKVIPKNLKRTYWYKK